MNLINLEISKISKGSNGLLTLDGLLFFDRILLQSQEIAENILKVKSIEGVINSGGEPILRAKDLSILIDFIKVKRDFSSI